MKSLISASIKSGLERVVRYILASVETSRNPKATSIQFEKKVLASLLGMTAETLSRTLQRLEIQGFDVDGSRITIKDRAVHHRLLEK